MHTSMNGVVVYLLLFLIAVEFISCQNCPTAPSTKGDRRTDKTKLRVVSYNVEWLFLFRDNPWSPNNIDKHAQNIAAVIKSLDPDIIVMPEVEDCRVLDFLVKNTVLSSSALKPYLVVGTDTATGQNVGILTKIDPDTNLLRTEERVAYPMEGNTCKYTGSEKGTNGVSKHFYTTFTVPGLKKKLLLVGVHFLAFPTTPDRCIKREAQASVIRTIVEREGLNKNYEVIVAGDFNDYDSKVIDVAGSVPTSRVMSMIKGTQLKNVLEGYKPLLDTYSSWYDQNNNCIDDGGIEHTVIDHILVSSGLRVKSVKFDRSYSASCTSIVSDHWPVVVDIHTTDSVTDADTPPVMNSQIVSPAPSHSGIMKFAIVFSSIGIVVAVFVGLYVLWRRRKNNNYNNIV